jgi:hypothetical protein
MQGIFFIVPNLSVGRSLQELHLGEKKMSVPTLKVEMVDFVEIKGKRYAAFEREANRHLLLLYLMLIGCIQPSKIGAGPRPGLEAHPVPGPCLGLLSTASQVLSCLQGLVWPP